MKGMKQASEDRLRVSYEDVLDEVERLDSAIATYRELGEKPLQGSLSTLGQMHSNFVARFERLAERIDDENSNLLETLDFISLTASEIAEGFMQVDVDLTSAMDGED